MKENNKIATINGEEVKISLPRIGTRCRICGEPIEANNIHSWVKTSVPACPIVYVHRECIRERGYHEGFVTPSGERLPLFGNTKETKEDVYMTPEVEVHNFFGDWHDIKTRASFLAQFNFWPEHDCTVFMELHQFTVANLHGMKERYRNLEKWVDMKDSSCGHHINFSWKGLSYSDIVKIRENARALFNPVENEMENDKEATKKVFGRSFTYYASNNGCYWHGSWMNLDNSNRLECRLPHYESPEQITWCFMLIKEWAKILRSFCNDEITAEKAGKKIAKEFLKNAQGKATYQRREQNSKI